VRRRFRNIVFGREGGAMTTPMKAGGLPVEVDPRFAAPGSMPRLLDAVRIAQLPRSVIAAGVVDVRLWSDGHSSAGKMRLDPDARLATHTHRRHCHHVWVVDGVAITMGRTLTPGSYAYVPPGQPHDLVGGSEGATVFYLHLDTGGQRARP
jgi:mannose-6-phosphate isomerase-like protein (cupin superfamily)